jgi:hypothetical protein
MAYAKKRWPWDNCEFTVFHFAKSCLVDIPFIDSWDPSCGYEYQAPAPARLPPPLKAAKPDGPKVQTTEPTRRDNDPPPRPHKWKLNSMRHSLPENS